MKGVPFFLSILLLGLLLPAFISSPAKSGIGWSTANQLTSNIAEDEFPSISIDGEKIIFHSNVDVSDKIFIINSDGTELTQLVNNTADPNLGSAISGDGTKIAYTSGTIVDGFEIFVINSDCTGLIQLTSNTAADFFPSISGDGTKIAFQSLVDGDWEIFIINSDGTGLTQLTSNSAEDEYPCISGDGSKIAFQSNVDGDNEIFVINFSASNKIQNIDTGLYYSSIQTAIDAPETLGGHTIFVDSGIYYENVVVTKSISLIGENVSNTIIDARIQPLFPVIASITKNLNITIKGFTLQNGYVGLSFYNQSSLNVSQNIIKENLWGIYLESSNNNIVSGNTLINNTNYGIVLNNSSYNTLCGNNVINNNWGIYIDHESNNCIFSGNNITNNDETGIFVENSSNATISANNITANNIGVTLSNSFNNLIFNNTLTNKDHGIFLVFSPDTCISGNTIKNSTYGAVFLDTCSNVTISDNNITQTQGILFGNLCNSNLVIENTLINNTNGITVYNSNNNTFSGNIVSKSTNLGVFISNSSDCYIAENIIQNNDNTGIIIYDNSNNTVVQKNTIRDNDVGLYFMDSWNNLVLHNAFIDNTIQIISASGDFIWDAGYPSGGNYWGDYVGVDLYGGVGQDVLGSDGIGDAPYVIDGLNQDNYPLMKPYGTVQATYNIIVDEESVSVDLASNSTVTDFSFNETSTEFIFTVAGPDGTAGSCNMSVPKTLGETFTVTVDGTPLTFTQTENATHYFLYFTYMHSTHTITITATTNTYELSLSAGWNMVSFPALPEDASFSSIFSGVGFYQVLTWDGSSYVTPTVAEAGVGYWVLVLAETTVSIEGAEPVTSYTKTLPGGWSMIGSVYGEPLNADDVFPGFYQLLTWDGTSYVTSTTIEPGKGYWALVLEPTTITVGG